MPKSIYGFGTGYYGERDYRNDGSYLTTNFFCILFFPVVPLHTVRVIPDPKNLEWSPVGENYYLVLEKRAPNLLQTASVYLCELAVVALMVLYFARIGPFLQGRFSWLSSRWLEMIPFWLTITPPFIIVRVLRNNARKRAYAQGMSRPAVAE
jgi:hypothetical protein